MGGPIKPFLWALGFDPIITAVEGLTGRPTPTYVDDVAITVQQALGLWRASLALLAAVGAAGLVVELHHCRGGIAAGREVGELAFLSRLQLRVQHHRDGAI
eukprot:466366-Alexandrium_andersonii.AAC.1